MMYIWSLLSHPHECFLLWKIDLCLKRSTLCMYSVCIYIYLSARLKENHVIIIMDSCQWQIPYKKIVQAGAALWTHAGPKVATRN